MIDGRRRSADCREKGIKMALQNRKIIIIGAGHVGSHAGYALVSQGLAEEIVYIDVDVKKAEA